MLKKFIFQGEGSRHAKISMIPLAFQDIIVATNELIKDNNNNSILGYKYVQTYGDINDVNKSIIILININNMHWICSFYNENASEIIIDYIIPS